MAQTPVDGIKAKLSNQPEALPGSSKGWQGLDASNGRPRRQKPFEQRPRQSCSFACACACACAACALPLLRPRLFASCFLLLCSALLCFGSLGGECGQFPYPSYRTRLAPHSCLLPTVYLLLRLHHHSLQSDLRANSSVVGS